MPEVVFNINLKELLQDNAKDSYFCEYLIKKNSSNLFLINLGEIENKNMKKFADKLIVKCNSIKNIKLFSAFEDLKNCSNGELIIYQI